MAESVCRVQATRKMQRRRIWHPTLLIIRMVSLSLSRALCDYGDTNECVCVFFSRLIWNEWEMRTACFFFFLHRNNYKWMKTPFLAPWMHFNMLWNKHHLIVHPKWSAFEMRDIECFAVVCKCHWGCMEIFVLSVYFAVPCTFRVHCVSFVYVCVCVLLPSG